jgi:hypothetical protein
MVKSRINGLSGLRVRLGGRPSVLDYPQVEQSVKLLAARLIDKFGRNAVRKFHYTAIPRGGVFVFGILSYVLDLPLKQPNFDVESSSTLVVLDDCSLSGARFAWFLNETERRPIIFASLYSHPDLRASILSQEPEVIGCLSAHDLKDLAPEIYPTKEAYDAWRQRWESRSKAKVYWIGLPELVIFPWNEPDRPVWNAETNSIEDNWRLASPDRCLKNWGKLGLPPKAGVRAVVRIPDQVAYTIQQDDVTLCNLEDETVYGLSGPAADIWRGLAAYGDLTATRDYLLELYEVDGERLTADIAELVETLLAKGLLERVNDPSPA